MSTLKTITCLVCGGELHSTRAMYCSAKCKNIAYEIRTPKKRSRRKESVQQAGVYGLELDPYATGALKSDAMHCPVM